jgi:TATA-binding protein-associated factor
MSDSDNDVRLLATTSFATLVKLVPLEAGALIATGISNGSTLRTSSIWDMNFLSRSRPSSNSAEIAFLNRYNLHGILCDDMGLGKTLQTICIVASDHLGLDRDWNFERLNLAHIQHLGHELPLSVTAFQQPTTMCVS